MFVVMMGNLFVSCVNYSAKDVKSSALKTLYLKYKWKTINVDLNSNATKTPSRVMKVLIIACRCYIKRNRWKIRKANLHLLLCKVVCKNYFNWNIFNSLKTNIPQTSVIFFSCRLLDVNIHCQWKPFYA